MYIFVSPHRVRNMTVPPSDARRSGPSSNSTLQSWEAWRSHRVTAKLIWYQDHLESKYLKFNLAKLRNMKVPPSDVQQRWICRNNMWNRIVGLLFVPWRWRPVQFWLKFRFVLPRLWQRVVVCIYRILSKELKFVMNFPLRGHMEMCVHVHVCMCTRCCREVRGVAVVYFHLYRKFCSFFSVLFSGPKSSGNGLFHFFNLY